MPNFVLKRVFIKRISAMHVLLVVLAVASTSRVILLQNGMFQFHYYSAVQVPGRLKLPRSTYLHNVIIYTIYIYKVVSGILPGNTGDGTP